MSGSSRITVLIALGLVLSGRISGADLFELPDPFAPDTTESAAAPTTATPRERQRVTQATLAEHAVYYAFTELGIGAEKQAEVMTKMSQMESVRSLPPEKAFLVGIRVAGRIQNEMNHAAAPASLAARNALRELAAYRTALPVSSSAPANAAARLEQAIAAARAALISLHPRFQYTKWLEEALAEPPKNPA